MQLNHFKFRIYDKKNQVYLDNPALLSLPYLPSIIDCNGTPEYKIDPHYLKGEWEKFTGCSEYYCTSEERLKEHLEYSIKEKEREQDKKRENFLSKTLKTFKNKLFSFSETKSFQVIAPSTIAKNKEEAEETIQKPFLAISSEGILQEEDLELELYTGLKDCKGVEIYEGDILQYVCGGEDDLSFFDEEMAKRDLELIQRGLWFVVCWNTKNHSDVIEFGIFDSLRGLEIPLLFIDKLTFEIIGNVHRDEALLREDADRIKEEIVRERKDLK